MVRFLIATHGMLSDGFKSSVSVLMGDEIANNIGTINAFVENGDLDPKGRIEEIVNALGEDEELIIFTDLMYGSVNQFAVPYSNKNNVHVITGINFPVICEVISKLTFSYEEKKVSTDELLEIIDKSRGQLTYVKVVSEDNDDNEEEFFD